MRLIKIVVVNMHHDQISIRRTQVEALIADQAPQWRGLEVRLVEASGTASAIFRIGDSLTARFRLREEVPASVENQLRREAAAMTEFRHASAFAGPEPLFMGQPGRGYSLPWSVQTWLTGVTPTPTSAAASFDLAADLAALIRSLRAADTQGRAFDGQNRGGDLATHDTWVGECLRRSAGLLDTDALSRLWARLRDLPREDPDVMSHTDLIPGNLLLAQGRLSGVLDTGDFCAADPALDLVAGWHLLADGPREVLRTTLECSDLQWERGKAWAFEQAIGLVWYYQRTNPTMAHLGRTTLSRLLEAQGRR